MIDAVINLIALDNAMDKYGVQAAAETVRPVFCQLDGVTRSEFFNARRSGIRSEYKFRLFATAYQGETLLEYGGRRMSVYRVYPDGDYLELYAGRYEGGDTNGT